MGQKVHPEGHRLKINRTWRSRWYARGKQYRAFLLEDLAMRHFLEKKLRNAAIAKIIIQRLHKKCLIEIHTARPGVIIGRKGADIIILRQQLKNMTSLCEDVRLQLVEERKPEINATLIADSIARQLEKRVMFRRAMKRALQMAMRLGAKGIRIECSGRLGGIEIARREWYLNGSVPLHTLRSDVDYAQATARTTYGTCGVKVWVNKGEVVHYDIANEKVLYAGQKEKDDASVVAPLSVA